MSNKISELLYFTYYQYLIIVIICVVIVVIVVVVAVDIMLWSLETVRLDFIENVVTTGCVHG